MFSKKPKALLVGRWKIYSPRKNRTGPKSIPRASDFLTRIERSLWNRFKFSESKRMADVQACVM